MKDTLKSILQKACISYKEVGNALGIKSLSTISLKINGKADFSTNEAIKLKQLINTKTGLNYTLEDLFN